MVDGAMNLYTITNDQRDAVYQQARRMLTVLPAAQVSYAFYQDACLHGHDAAFRRVPTLMARVFRVPPALWASASDKIANQRIIDILLDTLPYAIDPTATELCTLIKQLQVQLQTTPVVDVDWTKLASVLRRAEELSVHLGAHHGTR